MFGSLPFILLLILQGFARHDSAEFLLGHQELVNIPAQARSLKAFDSLFVHLALTRKDQKNGNQQIIKISDDTQPEVTRFSFEGNRKLERGFLTIQRSRDGPVA